MRFPNRRTRNSHFQLLFAADERPSSPVQRRRRRFKLPCTADVCIKGHSQSKNNKIIDATSNEKSSNLKPAPSRELRIGSKNAGDLILFKMYKALYSFKKTHPTSLSFTENDLFIELPGASGDKNW